MIVKLPFPATFDDLMKTDGKAELIGGRIIEYMATGIIPCRIATRILRSLDDHADQLGVGEAFGDSLGYAVDPPLTSGRQSFSPDASYFAGTLPTNQMGFVEGGPTFAVEVRSENDYGPAKDTEYADKRADYFEAGALVVWDVDPQGKTVTKYEANEPTNGVVFRPGDTAGSASAVHGWRLDVTTLFA